MKGQKVKTKLQQATYASFPENRSLAAFISKNSNFFWITAILASFLLCLFFFLYHIKDWHEAKDACFYEGKPTMATFDAYYFMRLTDDYLSGNYSSEDTLRGGGVSKPLQVPLLVQIAGLIRSLTGLSMEYVAWLLPPFLASFTVLIYAYWARFFQSPFLFVISSIIGSTANIWFRRTSLGRFDTDSLNLFFPGVLSASIFLFLTGRSLIKKLAGFLGIVVSVFLWHLWWPQGYNIGIILALGTYGISIFFIPGNRWEKVLKIVILTGTLIVASLIVLHRSHYLPVPGFLKYLDGYADLIFKTESTEPSVGTSISELKQLDLSQAATRMFGSAILAIPAILGAALTIITRPFFAILWAPFLALGIIGFFSTRFLIFLVPPLAFGLAFIPTVWFTQEKRFFKIKPKWKWIIGVALAIIFALPNVITNLRTQVIPNIKSELVHMAKVLGTMEPQNSPVWAWWDYGYLLQYYSKKKTFIDGGIQGPPRIIVSAYGFAMEDVVAAKNWINCFAHNDLIPLVQAEQEFGSKAKALSFMKEALSERNNLQDVLQKYQQGHNEKLWQKMLFPKTNVFVFIPVDFLKKSYWWYYYGTWDYDLAKGVHPLLFPFSQWFININFKEGYLTTLDGRKALFKKYAISQKGEHPQEVIVAPKHSATLLLTIPGVAMLVGENLSESAALKLYLRPDNYRSDFELLYYHPAYGGIWRTVPEEN
ncbi:MAG: hypothetical protein WHS38_00155 [Thermodesulforhabdaceae bacterium]